MAAKEKEYWYVLVITEDGPIFVTKVNNSDRTAEWDPMKKPLKMTKAKAEDLMTGLNLNFNTSYAVCQSFEITNQPYNYDKWHIEWRETEEEDY